MPKFDFYPSFNAGEVSPFIDARTSLEKYRSACRTLENFQILPYGGVIRRPGTEYRGAAKSATSQTRLIGFNFSTTTRFIIEMGVSYMRFWSGETGLPVTVATPAAWATGNIYSVGNYVREDNVTYYCKTAHTSGTFDTDLDAGRWVAQTILEVPTPYTATQLREVQFVQINDIMYFAHANHAPRKLSRLADNNWTFSSVIFDYPPLQEQNTTETIVNIYPNPDPWVAGTNYILGDYVEPPAWVASTTYAVGDIVLNGKIAYECITANTDATFTAAKWTAQNESGQAFYYYAMSAHRAGLKFGVDQAAGKWSQYPIPLNEMGKYSVSAGSSLFPSSTIGSQVELKWQKSNFYAEQVITGNYVSSTLAVEGGWDFSTTGTWQATIQILRVPSDVFSAGRIVATATRSGSVVSVYHPYHGWNDGDFICVGDGLPANNYATHGATINVTGTHTYTYPLTGNTQTGYRDIFPENLTKMEIVKEYNVDEDRNIISSGTESERCGLKIRILNWANPASTSTASRKARLETDTKVSGGIATIVKSGQINVDKWLGEGPRNQRNTKFWAFGAFSSARGYPRSVAMHEQRLCFGGTSSQPNTIWCSQIDNFENFKTGVTASDAVQFTLAASEGNRINWMYSQSQLLIGTSGDEWTIGSADSASSLSATNVQANRQSSYGSKYMRAALVNDVLLFVQRNGRKVRELVYELNKDGWVAPDLTLLAEHITNGEIVEVAYQQQPDAVLWCVRGDGTLIAMTYERDQKVVGWHRHTIADNADVESVATIYGNDTEDEVWMVVKRRVAGQDYRTIERFPLLWRTHLDNQTTASWRYLDGHFNFPSGALTPLTGPFQPGDPTSARTVSVPAHFNGKTVTIVQGTSVTTQLVTTFLGNTSITLYSTAAGYLGLPYTSTLTPMKLDMDLEDGSSQGRKKRIHKIIARLYKSRGGEIRTNNGEWYALANTLTTGDQKMILAGAFGIDADVSLRQTAPYPMAVIALQPVWDTFGNE
jgi:hypothetical protein